MTTRRLTYPRRSVENTGLFLTFRAYNYSDAPTPPGALPDIQNIISGSNRNRDITQASLESSLTSVYNTKPQKISAKTIANDANNTGVANISLYLPPKVEYNYGAEWRKISFGTLGSVFGNPDAGSFLSEVGKNVGAGFVNTQLKNLMNNGIAEIPKASGIDLDSLVGAAFGQTFNDNTLQTFNKMQTRNFSFEYLFVARNGEEELEIKRIIKQFKLGMHPEAKSTGRSNTFFLKYPYIWRIIPSGYKGKILTRKGGTTTDNSSQTPQVSDFLPNTKYCALKSMNVDYTPDNVIALTQYGFVQAVRLSLQFEELTTLVRQDIENFEDKTDLF
jgi:hypothetical protein